MKICYVSEHCESLKKIITRPPEGKIIVCTNAYFVVSVAVEFKGLRFCSSTSIFLAILSICSAMCLIRFNDSSVDSSEVVNACPKIPISPLSRMMAVEMI